MRRKPARSRRVRTGVDLQIAVIQYYLSPSGLLRAIAGDVPRDGIETAP
jgi:hypothetical protein